MLVQKQIAIVIWKLTTLDSYRSVANQFVVPNQMWEVLGQRFASNQDCDVPKVLKMFLKLLLALR